MFKQSYLTWSDEGPYGWGGGGRSCGQFTAFKDGMLRITTITFRVSQFTENNIVNEEQRRLHIDCFFWKLFIYVMMMGSFLVFFIYLIIGDVAKMSDRRSFVFLLTSKWLQKSIILGKCAVHDYLIYRREEEL